MNAERYPLQFEHEKKVIGSQTAIKYFNNWEPQRKWLDANNISRLEFTENEIQEQQTKKFQLVTKHKISLLAE